MKFSDYVTTIPSMLSEIFDYKQEFKRLDDIKGKIYLVGSGSSYSQIVYLTRLMNDYLPYPVVYDNPYSFVRYSHFGEDDVCIHFSQEARRNDNFCPMLFAKKRGGRTILFTSKKTSLVEEVDEVYWYGPECEKILVASRSYVSGYVIALQFVNAQLTFLHRTTIPYDLEKIIKQTRISLEKQYIVSTAFPVFLYAGYSQSVALEGALKTNECMLLDSEAYELKHYSHGKHFVSYNKSRIYNVLYHQKDQDLVSLYNGTIFERHHIVNRMESSLPPETAVFEWAMQMLTYIVQGMKHLNIELTDIPVRNEIIIPHMFTY